MPCPDCGAPRLAELSNGETTCTSCGLVVHTDRLEREPRFCDHAEPGVKQPSHDVYSSVCALCVALVLPESVINTATEIFESYTKVVRGAHRCLPCLYFLTKHDQNHIALLEN
jgi:transcription initiation factor TFIIIB Brf1 subunit/transcription initiation factor TFIIB